MEEVREANIPVVSEDFLQDVSVSTNILHVHLSVHFLFLSGVNEGKTY